MSTVTNYMLGSTQVRNIYYGSNLIWPLTHDYSQDYLTFIPLESCEFKFVGTGYTSGIYYSTDNGSIWNQLANDTYTPTINAGSKILFKSSSWGAGLYSGPGSFESTGRFNVEGNILSLGGGDNFTNYTMNMTSQYANLFMGAYVVDASNLYLPSPTQNGCFQQLFHSCQYLTTPAKLPYTNLSEWCYSRMFVNCVSLTSAPELPASNMTNECYDGMFINCVSLTQITCLATSFPSVQGTLRWVEGVAANGIFIKAPSMNSWTTGDNGIPSGWTVQDAS